MSNFDDIRVSTSTVIVPTNLEVNLEWLYTILDVFDSNVSNETIKTNVQFQSHIIRLCPEYGSITMVQYKTNLKGFKIVKKKKKYFRNALSIVMYVGKLITIKVPKKGKLQLTGCTNNEHAIMCVQHLWERISKHDPHRELYKLDGSILECTFRTVMTDIVFKLGFNINRQNLDRYMNRCTEFNSLLETSFGYTGVNIKIPFEMDFENTYIIHMSYDKGWNRKSITFLDYLNTLPNKERHKEMIKERRNTFLVFHSGTAIMSGMTRQYMRKVYNEFVTILTNAKKEIEENITERSIRMYKEEEESGYYGSGDDTAKDIFNGENGYKKNKYSKSYSKEEDNEEEEKFGYIYGSGDDEHEQEKYEQEKHEQEKLFCISPFSYN